MTKLYMRYIHECINDTSDGQFSWSQEFAFQVVSLHLSKPGVSCCSVDIIRIAGEVAVGADVWVLSVRWSEGDSFGTAKGHGEVIWLFRDKESAEIAAAGLETQKEDATFVFLDDTGEPIYISNPGFGFDNHITGVDITIHKVEK